MIYKAKGRKSIHAALKKPEELKRLLPDGQVVPRATMAAMVISPGEKASMKETYVLWQAIPSDQFVELRAVPLLPVDDKDNLSP
ncbi:hypothetical protein LJR039_007578 [Pseudorhodoferax sp. LjRoot39]|uniref:hypothetical protein n=1 Tax=Pseudorhodoferax sp. LjRoot39 TaxID=3342328 RepID=UPI003ED08137